MHFWEKTKQNRLTNTHIFGRSTDPPWRGWGEGGLGQDFFRKHGTFGSDQRGLDPAQRLFGPLH